MIPLLSLHAIAATRGEGLRPQLVCLLQAHAALLDPKVITLRQSSNSGRDQAGPNPVGRVEATSKGVLPFPPRHIGAIRQ